MCYQQSQLIINLVAHAGIGYETFGHDMSWLKVFLFTKNRRAYEKLLFTKKRSYYGGVWCYN